MKGGRLHRKIPVPILWRIWATLAMVPVAALTFYLLFRASGGQFPLPAGGSTDPYFFSFVFAIIVPILVWLAIDTVMRGIVARRSGGEIAADLAKDIAKATAVTVAEVVIDSALGGSSSNGSSSSSSGGGGKGGQYGGGGASGDY